MESTDRRSIHNYLNGVVLEPSKNYPDRVGSTPVAVVVTLRMLVRRLMATDV